MVSGAPGWGPEMPRSRERGGGLCRAGGGVKLTFHRGLTGSSKEEAGTLGVGGPVTGRPHPVQQDVSSARQRAGQAGGCGGDGAFPGPRRLGV